MEFSGKDYVSIEQILADVLLFVQEERYENLNKGWFISQIRQCLEELSYDTFFHEGHVYLPIPSNRIIEIPAGVFNIKQMSLFSGTVCDVTTAKNVYFKRNFFHLGSEGFFARNQSTNGNDPFYGGPGLSNIPSNVFEDNNASTGGRPSNLFYFGYSNGNIMLSDSCSQYANIMIRFNGIWTQEDRPVIPTFFRQVVSDWCVERALKVKAAMDPARWRTLWIDASQRLGYGQTNNFNGSWYKAEVRVKRMGSKQKEDLKEYLMRLSY